ncbi:16S rRNA (cytidine(1402)-2'-O)-methyltransferase [candidate division TA06 bacterium]|nr:16S rRNA (cytidine(1402)-2'-O)-methyltransferase [candidate division TA06 bacterium]
MSVLEPGLYLVATPIGNLEDITLRAIRVLKEVDLICAEDTRRAKILLKFYSIDTPVTSYYDYNKERKSPGLLKRLKDGGRIGLISEAGTPGISDPGFYLAKRALDAHIRVIPIPGSTALISALIASGLPTDRFLFEGFLPRKKGKRRKRLEGLAQEERTIVLFESPYRVHQTLQEIRDVLGDREVAVARELTKRFEEVRRGRVGEVLEYYGKKGVKGEVVIVLHGRESVKRLNG